MPKAAVGIKAFTNLLEPPWPISHFKGTYLVEGAHGIGDCLASGCGGTQRFKGVRHGGCVMDPKQKKPRALLNCGLWQYGQVNTEHFLVHTRIADVTEIYVLETHVEAILKTNVSIMK
jgi:hypothetical protein